MNAPVAEAAGEATGGERPAVDPARGSLWVQVRRAITKVPTWLRALLFYVVLAVMTIGWHAILHPQTVCACLGTGDPAQFMWAMVWWPYTLVHGLNPFVTHYLWSPTGVNLAQAAMVPTAALAMAPFTALFGPIFSYNFMTIASPALASFTAYLLCRRLVKREMPAIAGGLLFGFSSYEFSQLLGHLNLVLIFLIPVMVHITLRRVDREISRRAYVIVMALLLVLQLGLSTELLAEIVMLGMVMLVAARFLAVEPQRGRMNSLIGETVFAGLIAAVVTSPYLYYAFFSGKVAPANSLLSDAYPLDVANLIFPTLVTWLGHHDFQSLWSTFDKGDVSEANGYFGIAIVIAFGMWFCTGGRRTVLGKLLAVAIAISVPMALGSHLHVAGEATVSLPYNWVKDLPIFNYIIPSRIVMYAGLAISIGVAAWLARTGGHPVGRWALVLIGFVMIFPNLSSTLYGIPPVNPRFFTTNTYRHYLTRDETVLVLPFGHNDISTLWQAETHYYFYMPEGYVSSSIPPAFETQAGVAELFNNVSPPAPTLGSFIRVHEVSHVVVDPGQAGPWPGILAQLGLHGRSVGGVLLYSVPNAPA